MRAAIPKNEMVDAIFCHVRNLTTAVVVIAAGLVASRKEWGGDFALPLLLGSSVAGYVVAGIGMGLVALNSWDGVSKIAALAPRHRVLVRILVGTFNALVTLRVVQALVLMQLR